MRTRLPVQLPHHSLMLAEVRAAVIGLFLSTTPVALALVLVSALASKARSEQSLDFTSLVLQQVDEPISELRVHKEYYEFTDRSLFTAKYLLDGGQRPATSFFDDQGEPVDDSGQALRHAEADARFAFMGALDDELWELTLATGPSTRIPVGIWLRTYEQPFAKELLLTDAVLAQFAAWQRDSGRIQSQEALQKDWPEMASGQLLVDPNAPIAFAELTPEEIYSVSDHPYVAAVYWDKPSQATWTTYVDTVNADITGYSGAQQGVCIVEPDDPVSPNGLTIAAQFCPGGTTNAHGNLVAGIVRASSYPFGVATGATIHFSDFIGCSSTNANAGFAWCASQGADVWNFSHTCSTLDNRIIDYRSKQTPYPLVVAASGNLSGDTAGSCPSTCTNSRGAVTCKPFNGLVVGGANDCGDTNRLTDKIWCGARDINVDGRELPHLVAPAKNVDADGVSGTGTSCAAPQVAGVAAQLLEKDSLLNSWPEALRSVLMVGADENVDGVRLSLVDGVDDRDGVGELNAMMSVAVAGNRRVPGSAPSQFGYHSGTITQASTPAGTFVAGSYRASHLIANGKFRIVLSWDSTATCTNPDLSSATCASDVLDADLDFYVYRDSTGALVAGSNTVPNSYEFVEFSTTPGETYTIRIYVNSWTNSYTYFGISWFQASFGT